MTTHEWRDRDEAGHLIYYRAKHHAGKWTFASRPKGEEYWTHHDDDFPLDQLREFREVLWNKIQRRRAPEKLIDQIDEMIAKGSVEEEE